MHSKEAVSSVINRMKTILGIASDTALSEHFGGHKTLMSNKKVRGSIPFDEAMQLALEKGISLDWLILGKGPAPSGTGEELADYADTIRAAAGPSPLHSSVPMYDIEAAAGAGRCFDEEEIEATLYFQTTELEAHGLDPARVVGVKVRGDSMDGTLTDGDWVLVDLVSRDPKQEGVFLLLVSGERRIKRVQRLAGGALYLISDNEHYRPEMIPPEQMHDVEILGRCEIRIGRVS
ncbi:LexA family transcriptional regulator [Halomonas sp. HK25]|uniref:LexA family transcriptional regulator n=1 Tax=Halomonas sp. HK25 TaxID=3394321 RepID=UPI0039FB893C